ncbi:MAG: hypothetical protein SPL12_06355 [Bacteroidales bacterium]|nr:hypothetical protein [Bacteroidales bacterium]
MQPADSRKAVGQKQLHPAPASLPLGADAPPQPRAVYKYMYAVAQPPTQALPPHAQRTALIHSCFHQPHPRQPPPRKPQPREIHPAAAIRAIRPQFRRASLRAIRIIRRSKTRMVLL